MFIMHVALQGCLRGAEVEYGITADTGGHIRYLLDLVRASAAHPAIRRIEIVTRAFAGGSFGSRYAAGIEPIEGVGRIVRLPTTATEYLPKEALWQEHDSFVAALERHLRGLDRLPDLIHAHYADAGRVAAAMRDRFAIPFLFTAHSLGRVKRDSLPPSCRETEGIERRIAIEDAAIAAAVGIVASSRDEAEAQFGVYPGSDPGRIRIIPPGSDLALFRDARSTPRVRAMLGRFLRRPELPAILAIARPVTRKNLPALLHAYGRSPALRARANLVIVAGNRDTLDGLEPEIARNLEEMLRLVDRYDLWGEVALPKQHEPDDVAALYAFARERRGVFVNPALNEPFGLTLVEAAAAGLPVVATASGGAGDIVRDGGNGILVDPRRPEAIGAAILSMLRDPAAWDRFAAAGCEAAGRYDWTRHVAGYAAFAEGLCRPPPPPPAAPRDERTLLVSDIDGTLIGCSDSLRRFADWHAGQSDLLFGLATGRSFHSALSILAQSEAPFPEVLIASVGSEIFHLDPNRVTYRQDQDWARQIARGWDRDAVAELVRRRGGLEPQAPPEQRARKLSYFTGGDAEATARIRDLLAEAGHACSVIQSHRRYLDILPLGVSKGTAIEHVRQQFGLPRDSVVVAGDGFNDVEMLRSVPHAILVANHVADLATLPDLSHSYIARTRYARGVMEGVEHFTALRAAR